MALFSQMSDMSISLLRLINLSYFAVLFVVLVVFVKRNGPVIPVLKVLHTHTLAAGETLLDFRCGLVTQVSTLMSVRSPWHVENLK